MMVAVAGVVAAVMEAAGNGCHNRCSPFLMAARRTLSLARHHRKRHLRCSTAAAVMVVVVREAVAWVALVKVEEE